MNVCIAPESRLSCTSRNMQKLVHIITLLLHLMASVFFSNCFWTTVAVCCPVQFILFSSPAQLGRYFYYAKRLLVWSYTGIGRCIGFCCLPLFLSFAEL